MPRLLAFAACEKAILDRDDFSLTLAGIFTTLAIEIPPDEDVPANASIPRQWFVGVAWLRDADDGERRFQQRIEILAPDGSSQGGGNVPFQMTHRNFNTVLRNQLFPIGQPGEYNIVLSLRDEADGEWQEIARFPILVQHIRPQPAAQEPAEQAEG